MNPLEAGICLALTGIGLVLSWLTWRRSGARHGVRVGAWALLPLAVYLTGAVGLVGRIADAITRFAGSFVFSLRTWAGVGLLGLIVVLLLISGGLPSRRGRRREAGDSSPAGQPKRAQPAPGPSVRGPKKQSIPQGLPDGGDDFADVAEILRRRGIS